MLRTLTVVIFMAWGVAMLILGCGGTSPGLEGLPEPSGPPFARVVQMSDSHRVAGPMARGMTGDWLLENDRFQVVVNSLENRGGFAYSGGTIVDAAPRGGEDLISEIFTYFDDTFPRQAVYTELEPVSHEDSSWTGLIARGADSDNPDLEVETRYRVSPGSAFLELETTVRNVGRTSVLDYEVGDVIEWGRARPFAPGPGRDLIGRRQVVPFILGSDHRTSYVWINDDGDCAGPHGKIWSDPFYKVVDLDPGDEVVYRRRMGVLSGSPATAGALAWGMRGRQLGSLEVEVESDRGMPVDGAEVDAFDQTNRHNGWGVTGPSGTTILSLPPGVYRVRVTHPHRGSREQSAVQIDPDSGRRASFRLDEPATLELHAVDQDGLMSPARWTFEGLGETPAPDLGPNYLLGGTGAQVQTPGGTGTVRLPAGDYRVIASRGPAYEAWETRVELRPGARMNLRGRLEKLPIPDNWIAADLHVHSLRSPDSGVTLRDRVQSLVCEGVEWFAASDHGYRTDYHALLDTLDLAAPLGFTISEEVTTTHLGHFGVYPLDIAPHLPGHGGLNPYGMTLDEIFEHMRRDSPEGLIQVNHPRAGRNGYFSLVGPPETADSTGLRLDFDVLEIMNGKSQGSFPLVWADWMTLLKSGRRIIGVGNSDTHLVSGEEPGYPRNYLYLEGDQIDEPAIMNAVREGRVMATNGPLVHFTLEGEEVGSTVTRAPGTVRGHIKVLAPSWADVSRVIVTVNGVDDAIFMVKGRDRAVRFDQGFDLELRRSAFVLVRVEGDDGLEPVVPPLRSNESSIPVTPVAFTNPIWVEINRSRR